MMYYLYFYLQVSLEYSLQPLALVTYHRLPTLHYNICVYIFIVLHVV